MCPNGRTRHEVADASVSGGKWCTRTSLAIPRSRSGAHGEPVTIRGAKHAPRFLEKPSMAPIVAVVFVVSLLSAPFASQDQPAGYIKIVAGAAVILRGGAEMPARPGDGLYQDDGLRTGAD